MHRIAIGVALATLLTAAACTDDPGPSVVAPEDAALTRSGPGAASAPIGLMSRNLYLGADIDHVLEDPLNGGAIAWAEIMYTNYPERAAELAAEIATRRPHLVGLQEVSRYLVLDPATQEPVPGLGLDFLDILAQYLDAYGASYAVVTRAQNFQAVLPVGDILLQYTDGDAILARADVTVHAEGWDHYALENQVDLDVFFPGLGYNLRGYQWADVTAEGQRFLFVNTHLEIQRWADEQVGQAGELLDFVDAWDSPVFMVGDFNSAANPDAPEASRTATYGMILEAGFDDLWLRGHGRFATDGLTCCQAGDLSNQETDLNQRIDFLFGRNVPSSAGYAGGADLEVVGDEPSDRFLTSGDYYLWPSDHAGLYGELWMPRGLMADR